MEIETLEHEDDGMVTSHKLIRMETGNKIHMRRRNPYGHVHISFERGPIPAMLSGMFTSYDEAVKAVTKYLSDKGKELPQKAQ